MASENDSCKVALNFIAAINRRDVEAISSLMTKGHRFVDGLGNSVVGKTEMREGWTLYFKMFPDYMIDVQTVLQSGNTVGIFGTASATFSADPKMDDRSRTWKIPAAWRARIKDGLVDEWQVYADNEPVWKIMGVKRY